MNVVEKALSSARFNRLIFWIGLVVLAAGALGLVLKFAGGSDNAMQHEITTYVESAQELGYF